MTENKRETGRRALSILADSCSLSLGQEQELLDCSGRDFHCWYAKDNKHLSKLIGLYFEWEYRQSLILISEVYIYPFKLTAMSGTSSDQLHRSTLTVYSVSLNWLLVFCFWFLFMVWTNWFFLCVGLLEFCVFLYVLHKAFFFLIVEPDGTFQSRTPEACCFRKQLCQSLPRWVTVWLKVCLCKHMHVCMRLLFWYIYCIKMFFDVIYGVFWFCLYLTWVCGCEQAHLSSWRTHHNWLSISQ